jgi:hypothetical protein
MVLYAELTSKKKKVGKNHIFEFIYKTTVTSYGL